MSAPKTYDRTVQAAGVSPEAPLQINGMAVHNPANGPAPANKPRPPYLGRLRTTKDWALLSNKFMRAWVNGQLSRADLTATFYALRIGSEMVARREELEAATAALEELKRQGREPAIELPASWDEEPSP